MARHFKPHDKALTASIRDGQAKIFAEDLQMLESQQKNLLAHPSRSLLKLNIDAGGVRARAVLDRLLVAEAQATPPAA
jgi:vanillate monooxygenase